MTGKHRSPIPDKDVPFNPDIVYYTSGHMWHRNRTGKHIYARAKDCDCTGKGACYNCR